jgi:hypothetical protein
MQARSAFPLVFEGAGYFPPYTSTGLDPVSLRRDTLDRGRTRGGRGTALRFAGGLWKQVKGKAKEKKPSWKNKKPKLMP